MSPFFLFYHFFLSLSSLTLEIKTAKVVCFLEGTLSALPWLAALFQFQLQKHSPLMNHLVAHIKVFSSFVCCPEKSFRQSPTFVSRNLSMGDEH